MPTSGRRATAEVQSLCSAQNAPLLLRPDRHSDHSARADSTRCKSAPMDGDGVGLWMSFFFGLRLDDGSVGFSTRRDDPSNREFSLIDSDL
jgi:hypothetical protein